MHMYTRVRGEYAACVCVFMPLRRGPRMAGPGLFLPRGPDVPDGCLWPGAMSARTHTAPCPALGPWFSAQSGRDTQRKRWPEAGRGAC